MRSAFDNVAESLANLSRNTALNDCIVRLHKLHASVDQISESAKLGPLRTCLINSLIPLRNFNIAPVTTLSWLAMRRACW